MATLSVGRDPVPGKYQPRTRMDEKALVEIPGAINQDPKG